MWKDKRDPRKSKPAVGSLAVCTEMGHKTGPRLRESRLLAPGHEFTQPRAHRIAQLCMQTWLSHLLQRKKALKKLSAMGIEMETACTHCIYNSLRCCSSDEMHRGLRICLQNACSTSVHPGGCHQGSKSALLTDFRKFPLSRREGRKKRAALSEEGATQSEIS